jgi:hypothetical protein
MAGWRDRGRSRRKGGVLRCPEASFGQRAGWCALAGPHTGQDEEPSHGVAGLRGRRGSRLRGRCIRGVQALRLSPRHGRRMWSQRTAIGGRRWWRRPTGCRSGRAVRCGEAFGLQSDARDLGIAAAVGAVVTIGQGDWTAAGSARRTAASGAIFLIRRSNCCHSRPSPRTAVTAPAGSGDFRRPRFRTRQRGREGLAAPN